MAYAKCPGAHLAGRNLNAAAIPFGNFARGKLHRAIPTGALVSHADFTKADLGGGNLIAFAGNEVKLAGADLSNTSMTFAGLVSSDLHNASLAGADLAFGQITGSDLRGANMRGINLSDSDTNGDDFRGADLSGANLANADFTGSKLQGAKLTGASFCNTVMPDGTVRAPQPGLCPGQIQPAPPGEPITVQPDSPYYPSVYALQFGTQVANGTNVRGCLIRPFSNCRGAGLQGASLQGLFMAYARFDGADLRDTNMQLGSVAFGTARGARFDGAQLGGATFASVMLRGASLRKVSLALTLFDNADMRDVDLSRANGLSGVFDGADLRRAKFRDAKLAGASLVGVDLRGADLRGADVSEAVLAGSKLKGARTSGARFCRTVMPDGKLRSNCKR